MKTLTMTAAVAAATLAMACQTTPERNATLETARATVDMVKTKPLVATAANEDLTRAEASLREAEAAFKRGEDAATVDHLAYLAKQHALVAQKRSEVVQAQKRIETASAERNRVLLATRTRALQAERAAADSAESRAQAAEQQAAATEQRARQAETEAAAKGQRAAQAEQQVAAIEQRAMAAQQEAEAARREALAAAERAEKYKQEMQALAAKPTPHGMVVTLSDVLFDTGSANLKPGAQRRIDQLAEFMKQHSERKLRIEGFTDSTGSADTNQALSERRAAAVRTALIERGVAPERLETVGYGPAFPVASNDIPAGRQQNRRVEIVISDERGELARR